MCPIATRAAFKFDRADSALAVAAFQSQPSITETVSRFWSSLCQFSTRCGRSRVCRPAFEQRTAAIDFDEAFHLIRTGVEIVLEHLNCGIDFIVFDAIAGELKRARHDPRAVDVMFDVELA